MDFSIEFEREDDGHWIAEAPELPGVMVYGATQNEAKSKVQSLALRVIADRLEREGATTDRVNFAVAWATGPARRLEGFFALWSGLDVRSRTSMAHATS